VRDGAGTVRAAMNVTVHAAETSVDKLVGDYLPLLLLAASDLSADWALWESRPYAEVGSGRVTGAAGSGRRGPRRDLPREIAGPAA